MQQTIRNNVFETNSSSVHSIVIEKSHYDICNTNTYNDEIQYDKYWNVNLLTESDAKLILEQPEEILKYLYTVSIILAFNPLEDKLKKLFPNCVFQKPLYDINDEYEYCDDRTITNFCDVVNADLPSLVFSQDELWQITENCLSIIFHGIITISRDENYCTIIEDYKNYIEIAGC